MSLDEVEKCVTPGQSGEWNSLYLILGLILMPVAMPFVLMECFYRFRVKRYRNELAEKVCMYLKSVTYYNEYICTFQVVLITGASSGLGESLAHTFYKAGCKLILAARRTNELERVKKDLLALDVVSAFMSTRFKCKRIPRIYSYTLL